MRACQEKQASQHLLASDLKVQLAISVELVSRQASMQQGSRTQNNLQSFPLLVQNPTVLEQFRGCTLYIKEIGLSRRKMSTIGQTKKLIANLFISSCLFIFSSSVPCHT